MPVTRRSFVGGLAAFTLAGCGKTDSGTTPSVVPSPSPTPTPDRFTVIAVGDMGDCSRSGTEVTARLVEFLIRDSAPDVVRLHTLGDHAYPSGRKEDYVRCFEPAWGQFVPIVNPCVGNHDWEEPSPYYFTIFGQRAIQNGRDGYYSYAERGWLVLVLNSMLLGDRVRRAEQADFVRRRLTEHPGLPVLGIWHHPRWGHGENGDTRSVQEFLDFFAGRLRITLHGHEHHYERFRLLAASGVPDAAQGFRPFVVGTGGSRLYAFRNVRCAMSEFRYFGKAGERETFGVIRLRLYQNGTYAFEYWIWPDGAAAPLVVDSDTRAERQTCP